MYLEDKKVGNGITQLFEDKLLYKKEALGRRCSKTQYKRLRRDRNFLKFFFAF